MLKKILATVFALSAVSTPALARSISMKEAGTALWVFIIIGSVIVLLQLIPAVILFFSFIGTTVGGLKKVHQEDSVEVAETAKELA